MAQDSKVASAFHEVYSKVPKNVVKTGKTGKAKTAMMTAIALSKAKAAGAKVPAMKNGIKELGKKR
jgi:DNA replication protein DnaC